MNNVTTWEPPEGLLASQASRFYATPRLPTGGRLLRNPLFLSQEAQWLELEVAQFIFEILRSWEEVESGRREVEVEMPVVFVSPPKAEWDVKIIITEYERPPMQFFLPPEDLDDE